MAISQCPAISGTPYRWQLAADGAFSANSSSSSASPFIAMTELNRICRFEGAYYGRLGDGRPDSGVQFRSSAGVEKTALMLAMFFISRHGDGARCMFRSTMRRQSYARSSSEWRRIACNNSAVRAGTSQAADSAAASRIGVVVILHAGADGVFRHCKRRSGARSQSLRRARSSIWP